MNFIYRYYQQHPLRVILLVGLTARLLAAFFAQGYMMHDDHFLTVEPAASWADGKNFNDWLPGIGNDREHPEPISFFYLGHLYILFKIFNSLGIDHPEHQMLLMRVIHALYSLLTVYMVYRITEKISERRYANTAGWLMATIAILPNFSVRNLVELVCMPPLLGGMYLLIRNATIKDIKRSTLQIATGTIILAAFAMGFAVGVRYQTGIFVAVTGVMLGYFSSFRNFLIFGFASAIAFTLSQADDIFLWGGQPFQHLLGYFEYNQQNAKNYPGSALAYASFISVFILPPVSLFLLYGFLKSYKHYLLIFAPTLAFLLFHFVFPNKQERFILPALPFFVILGTVGWGLFIHEKSTNERWQKIHTYGWRIFWVLNILAMLIFTFTYSKKSRVEAMVYLYEQGNCKNFVLEYTHRDKAAMLPEFYSGIWDNNYYWDQSSNITDMMKNFAEVEAASKGSIHEMNTPNYYIFYDHEKLDERVARIKNIFPSLTFRTKIEAGWFDVLLNRLNPLNTLEEFYIYEVTQISDLEPQHITTKFNSLKN